MRRAVLEAHPAIDASKARRVEGKLSPRGQLDLECAFMDNLLQNLTKPCARFIKGQTSRASGKKHMPPNRQN